MGKRRTVLGRGLEALIPSSGVQSREEARLDDIVPGRSQPRTAFEGDRLTELAESIRLHGILQPLIVSPADEHGKHRLIAGERRWQAARQAGLEVVPIIQRESEARQAVEIALVENLQREDLRPLEEAAAFDRLSRDHGLTQEQIAAAIGRSRSSVANTMRLLTLPPAVRQALTRGEITEGHGRALLGLDDAAAMEATLARVIASGLNVRQTEQLVASLRPASSDRRQTPTERPAALVQLEADLRRRFGAKVSVIEGRKNGRIVIEYYSDEELAGLADRLLGEEGPHA